MLPLPRKQLCMSSLLGRVRSCFLKVPDPLETGSQKTIPLVDHLMSGMAVFGLKCPSLLDYDKKRFDNMIGANLSTLYWVKTPPSDTYLRERLDTVNPATIRRSFTKLFATFQRGKGLEEFMFMDQYVLLSGDGSGLFSSNCVSCPHCCEKVEKNGKTTYYHQLFGVSIVHPDKRNVIPLCPEVIMKEDGATKNDCERNACKRFLENFRREHPHLKAIFLADGLSSTGPNIKMLEEKGLKYILGAKPGDHVYLFDQLDASEKTQYHELKTEDGKYHQFRFLNRSQLNKSHPDICVNVIEYRVTDRRGKELNFSWVTNLEVNKSNVLEITRGGRARWKIENETFNTLKNLGYNLEHNYGHGKQYLSTVFGMLMMLAFLIDQILEVCCPLFQRAKKKIGTYRGFWEVMRALFMYIPFSNWENFYLTILKERALDSS